MVCRAGGGGSGVYLAGTPGTATCGGGAGNASGSVNADGYDATPNTGGGGGGAGYKTNYGVGGDGASGLAIVRYVFSTSSSSNDTVSLVSQSPANLTATNGFNGLTLIYNYSNTTGLTGAYLNYTIASSTTKCAEIYNGTCAFNTNTYQQKNNSVYSYSPYCYQETTNSSNVNDQNCTLNYTGNYVAVTTNLYINYTKPNNATNATWRVSHGIISERTPYNVSIPQSCFNASLTTLQLMFYSQCQNGQYSVGFCYNGSSWINITLNYSGSINTPVAADEGYSNAIDGNWSSGAKYDPLNNRWSTDVLNIITDSSGAIMEEGIYWNIPSNNINSNSTYVLYDTDYYPGDYNYNQSDMIFTSHSSTTLASANNYLSIGFINITNTTNYNIFEIMLNSTVASQIYVCNSSYSSGNPTTSTYCALLGTINKTGYNHTHTSNSAHNLISVPINTTTGRIGAVQVSPSMRFLIRGSNTGTVQYAYITNTSREGETQTSSNNGATWTNQTYTIDAHIHQYEGNERFNFTGCQNKSGTITCSSLTSDLLDLIYLPPTPPTITNPTPGQNITRYLNVTYNPGSASSNATTLAYYNITLYNSTGYVLTIQGNNSLNLSYYYDTFLTNLSVGTGYYVRVTVYDSTYNSSYADSEPFNITANAQLNISVYDAYNLVNISNFTTSLYDAILGSNTSQNSTANFTSYYIAKNRAYIVYTDAGSAYALSTTNYTSTNLTNQNLSIGVYPTNSILINIYNDITNALINGTNISVAFSSNTTTYNFATMNGTLFVSNITSENYSITFSDILGTYCSQTYSISVNNRTTQTLNARLLPSSYCTAIGVYVRNNLNQAIPDSRFLLEKSINGSYVTILDDFTDVLGFIQISVQTGTEYKVSIQSAGYQPIQFLFKFYTALSPYTFRLSSNETTSFTDVFNSVYYSYSPTNISISNGTVTFSYNVLASPAILEWVSITTQNTTNATVNISGSPGGANPTKTENLSAFSGLPYMVMYCFDADGFDAYCFNITYLVRGGNLEPYTNNLQNTLNDYKNQILSDTTGTGWLAILAVFFSMLAAIIMYQLFPNPAASTIVANIILLIFTYYGWINPLITGGITAVVLVSFFYSRFGGTY